MDIHAKRELATAIKRTFEIREASYDRETGRYRLRHDEAAVEAGVDPDLVSLVEGIVVAGYWESFQWADAMLRERESV